jgi:hypothetical protein
MEVEEYVGTPLAADGSDLPSGLCAARLRGADKIKARFFDGDEASAFVLAVRLNFTHRLPLALTDRKAAADRIISRAAGPAARRPWTPRRKLQALTPGSAISEGAVRGRLRMFVFGRRVSKDCAAHQTHTRGQQRPVGVYRARRDVIRHPFRSERAGEIDMVSRASATLNLVTPTLLACLAALRLGHAAAFLPASIDHKLLEPPDSGTESWLQPRSASCLADQR